MNYACMTSRDGKQRAGRHRTHNPSKMRWTMPKHQIPPSTLARTAPQPGTPEQGTFRKKAPAQPSPFNIDDFITLPWIGLHYRHEFMLQHSHELLERRPLE